MPRVIRKQKVRGKTLVIQSCKPLSRVAIKSYKIGVRLCPLQKCWSSTDMPVKWEGHTCPWMMGCSLQLARRHTHSFHRQRHGHFPSEEHAHFPSDTSVLLCSHSYTHFKGSETPSLSFKQIPITSQTPIQLDRVQDTPISLHRRIYTISQTPEDLEDTKTQDTPICITPDTPMLPQRQQNAHLFHTDRHTYIVITDSKTHPHSLHRISISLHTHTLTLSFSHIHTHTHTI